MFDIAKNYWNQLESRERIILGWGGLIVAVILFYALIWQPWHKSIDSMEESIQEMRRDLVWVRQHGEIIRGGASAGEPKKKRQGESQSLLSVIESSAKKQKIRSAIQQMVPSNNDTQVRVVLEEVSFASWLKWIDLLNSRFGVNITDSNVELAGDKPDLVEVTVTFQRTLN